MPTGGQYTAGRLRGGQEGAGRPGAPDACADLDGAALRVGRAQRAGRQAVRRRRRPARARAWRPEDHHHARLAHPADRREVGRRRPPSCPTPADPQAYATQIGVPLPAWMANLRSQTSTTARWSAIDYQTGEIIAYVGSADYYASRNDSSKFQPQFDVLGATAGASPGRPSSRSTTSPASTTSTMTASTMFMDVTTNFGGGYIPTDADNLERGPVRVRAGARSSRSTSRPSRRSPTTASSHVFDDGQAFGMDFQTPTSRRPACRMALGHAGGPPHRPGDGVRDAGQRRQVHSATPSILRITDPTARTSSRRTTDAGRRPRWSARRRPYDRDRHPGRQHRSQASTPSGASSRSQTTGGKHRPATLKTGTNNDAKRPQRLRLHRAADARPSANAGQYALVGRRVGRQQRQLAGQHSPVTRVFSIDVTHLRVAGLHEGGQPRAGRSTNSCSPPGIATAHRRRLQRPEAGPLHDQDDQRALHRRHAAHADRRHQGGHPGREGDQHPVAGRLLRHAGDARLPEPQRRRVRHRRSWQAADRAWVARAARGPGVLGGPGPIKTRTTYFCNRRLPPLRSDLGRPLRADQDLLHDRAVPEPLRQRLAGPLAIGPPGTPPSVKPRRARPRVISIS